ncbi:MAG: hypothetical protein EBR86_07925 [Planctomycetia bacterium]|nr:hypothetical protein [Planctomycetia bacterium]
MDRTHANRPLYSRSSAAKVLIEWRRHSNTVRPHRALGYRPPGSRSLAAGERRRVRRLVTSADDGQWRRRRQGRDQVGDLRGRGHPRGTALLPR